MITAALEDALDKVEYKTHPVFGMAMPTTCPGVPSALLDPRSTWPNPADYDEMAGHLTDWFIKNFEKYKDGLDEEILQAGPVAQKKS
jgi:phosphoenolpyruvate carboxykinase (ATP)